MAGRMRILVAEDERVISRLIKQALTAAGHDVTGMQSCREAIALLEDERFDLVLLDLNLSDGNGFRVVEALQARSDVKPPVLLMTGEHALRRRRLASRTGGWHRLEAVRTRTGRLPLRRVEQSLMG